MIPILLGLLALAVVVVLLVASRRPSEVTVARSIVIAAAPSAIFPEISVVKRFDVWNPFMKADPAMKKSYEGPESGPGAAQRWSGNSKGGEGIATVIAQEEGRRVRYRIDMVRPMKCSNEAEFTLDPEGSDTRVTWTLYGKNGLFGKVFSLFVDCDALCGKAFESGLAELKSIVESAPAKRA